MAHRAPFIDFGYYSRIRRILRGFQESMYKIVTVITFILTLIIALIFVILFHFGRSLPDHEALSHYTPELTTRIYFNGDTLWRDYAKEHRLYASIDDIPHLVIKAFLAAEDKSFFIHPGLDFMGVARALIKNTMLGRWGERPMGASTITQQVAKNFLLTNDRNFTRKIKEAILSFRLEQTFSKQEILELYLNHIYLGHRCYGIRAAAEYYFGKSLNELNIAEIAFLATLPKAPETYQFHKNPELTKARRDWVIDRLYEEKYISRTDYITAKKSPIRTIKPPQKADISGDYFIEAVRQKLIEYVGENAYAKGGFHVRTTLNPTIQNLAHASLKYGLETYDKRHGYRGPLTHFKDYKLYSHESQRDECDVEYAREKLKAIEHSFINDAPQLLKHSPSDFHVALIQNMDGEKIYILTLQKDQKTATKGCIQKSSMLWATTPESHVLSIGDVILVRASSAHADEYTLEQIPEVTGGIIIMNPENGVVYALSGGYHFPALQYNAATQARRQAGSAFKPFVYLAALESGYTSQSRVLDAPLHIPLGFRTKDGRTTYSPRNYTRQFYGMTSLENGLVYSRNVMSVRLAMQIGMGPVRRMARVFGLHPKLPRQLAMVLGAGETTLLDITTAYAMIENGGYRIEPTLIHTIHDRHHHALYTHNIPAKTKRIVRESSLNQIKDMLRQVIERGTARRPFAQVREHHPHATLYGKTGTSNDYKDGWFVGCVDLRLDDMDDNLSDTHVQTHTLPSSYVIGVFVGFPQPKTMGQGESGGRVAAPIAAHFIDEYANKYKNIHGVN